MFKEPGGFTILDAPSLAARTSIRLGGNALAEIRAGERSDFEKLPRLLERLGGTLRVLGSGTNIIARDGQLPLVLLRLEREEGLAARVTADDAGEAILRVTAGTPLPALLARAAGLGLGGLEGLTGIPGSVGGALAMNAGSYGTQIGELVRGALVYLPGQGLAEKKGRDFAFAYRSCRLAPAKSGPIQEPGRVAPEPADWFFALWVDFALRKDDAGRIRARMREVYARKKFTQPVTAKSAGCVFKNPAPEAPAGRLLEESGLRGFGIGKMRFSAVHANFMINEGGGRTVDALELVEIAKERVFKDSGRKLDLEVRIWP